MVACWLRSPFGAIEDWNTQGIVFLIIWASCDRLSGRSRIGTTAAVGSTPNPQSLRSPFGAIEDWNRQGTRSTIAQHCCDRLSGRSRIGTANPLGSPWLAQVAIAFRGDRGLERIVKNLGLTPYGISQVAIAFRGDRGLELPSGANVGNVVRLRSPFGAIEDWNAQG